MQILTCLPLLTIIFPGNAEMVLIVLQSTANFQVGFLMDLVYSLLEKLSIQSEELGGKFGDMGFASAGIIQNVALLILFLIVVFTIGALLLLVQYFARKNQRYLILTIIEFRRSNKP